MAGLPRETIKWIQSLELSTQIRNPKWDLSNGYLIAEIFSWYFPHDITMHSFYNRDSLELKQRNWYILKNFIHRNQLDLNLADIDGTIHCREGAATQLIEKLYEILTNRKVKKVPPAMEVDYTDYAYQVQLPMHARSTAAKAVKNNLKLTEILADQSQIACSEKPAGWSSNRTILKSQKIINEHIEHRRQQRVQDPSRFGITSTLGDRCVRRPEPPHKLETEATHLSAATEVPSELPPESVCDRPLTREHSVHFKEVEVKQMDKSAFYQLPIQGY